MKNFATCSDTRLYTYTNAHAHSNTSVYDEVFI